MFDFDIELPKLKSDINPNPTPENKEDLKNHDTIDAISEEQTDISIPESIEIDSVNDEQSDFVVREIELDTIPQEIDEPIDNPIDNIENDLLNEDTITLEPIIDEDKNINEPEINSIDSEAVIPDAFESAIVPDEISAPVIETSTPKDTLDEITLSQDNLEELVINDNVIPTIDTDSPEVIDLSSFETNPINNIEPRIETIVASNNIVNDEVNNLVIPETPAFEELNVDIPTNNDVITYNTPTIETFDLDVPIENSPILPSTTENLELTDNQVIEQSPSVEITEAHSSEDASMPFNNANLDNQVTDLSPILELTEVSNPEITSIPVNNDIVTEQSHNLEEFILENETTSEFNQPENNTPLGQTVVYDTPNTAYEFKIDEPNTNAPTESIDKIEQDWAEKPIKQSKRDPVVVISTLLIIASIIMAAAYYFINNGSELPFVNNNTQTTTAPINNNNNVETWPLQGVYSDADNELCPDQIIELNLNNDRTFEFNDVVITDNICTPIQSTGTYEQGDEGMIILTTSQGESIPALFISATSHAEIRIRGAQSIELTLYRNA